MLWQIMLVTQVNSQISDTCASSPDQRRSSMYTVQREHVGFYWQRLLARSSNEFIFKHAHVHVLAVSGHIEWTILGVILGTV